MLKLALRMTSLLLLLLLLLPFMASAGAPAGHLESLDTEVREAIIQNLAAEGYMARFPNGQDVQRGVSAYLWDSRQWLKEVRFNNARQVDVLVCLMIKKGYGGFAYYEENQSFIDWCGKMVEQP